MNKKNFILQVCETDRETGDVTVRNYEFDSITNAEIATRLLIDITEYHNGSDFESTILPAFLACNLPSTNSGIGDQNE